MRITVLVTFATTGLMLLAATTTLAAPPAKSKPAAKPTVPELPWPPTLPEGKTVVTDTSPQFLEPLSTLLDGVAVAKVPPAIDFLYYPRQDHDDMWSNWGDGVAVEGKYYSTFGNHKGLDGQAFVCEYDVATKQLKLLADVAAVLHMPEGHYVPGKIHGRIDLARDGWLYYATARGATNVTRDKFFYEGDWILRTRPASGETEIIAQGPAGKATILAALTDPERMILYGGTVLGDNSKDGIGFFAYDLRARKVLYSDVGDGCYKCFMLASSTGRVYYVGQKSGCLVRYDPATPEKPPVVVMGQLGVPDMKRAKFDGNSVQPGVIGLRAATRETAAGHIYTVADNGEGPILWRFNTQTEQAEQLGPAAIGEAKYVTSLDTDPSGRYLYYVPGAHGGAEADGSPIVQYDVQTKRRKVIAFTRSFYEQHYGYQPRGTFGTALSPDGATLYVTWHGTRRLENRGKLPFDTTALMVVHIPESERTP